MKKVLSILVFLSSILLVSACGSKTVTTKPINNKTTTEDFTPNTDKEIKEKTEYITPYVINSSGEKTYIESRNGAPYIALSTEVLFNLIKDADMKDAEDTEKYFKLASEYGFNTMDVPIEWSMIEKDDNVFDYKWIKAFLDYAKKYNLKLNLLWYGSLTDGQTHTANIPSYVSKNEAKYSKIANILRYGVFGDLVIMDWTDKDLLQDESYAIYSLFNYIYDWSKDNSYDPVVMVQIGQGTDRFVRWRIEQYELLDENGEYLDNEYSWNMINGYIKAISKAVKMSSYRALTRVEFCEQNAVTNYVRNIKDIETIDIVCPTYLHSIGNTVAGITNFKEEYSNMPIINAENWAKDYNDKQVLATMSIGGVGYVSFQLSNPSYYVSKAEGDLFRRYDYDTNEFVEINNRATLTKNIQLGLLKAYSVVASTKQSNFVPLGINSSLKTDIQNVYTRSGVMASYNKAKDGLGFIISKDNYIYAFSTCDAELLFTNVTFTTASEGYFDEFASWVNEGSVALTNSNLGISLEAGKLYRIRVNEFKELPTTIPSDYLASDESIRG